MKTNHIIAAIFVVTMFIIETFHPIGDWVFYWFGYFGKYLGVAIAIYGFYSIVVIAYHVLVKYFPSIADEINDTDIDDNF